MIKMQRVYSLILACVLIASLSPQLVHGAASGGRLCVPVDLYLVLGQSNATGAGTIRTVGGPHRQRYRRYLRNFNRIDYYSRTSLKRWDNEVTDFGRWGPLRTRLGGGNGFGLELAFGRVLFDQKYKHEADQRLAIMKVAVGASPLMAASTDAYDSWGDTLVDKALNLISTRIVELAGDCNPRVIKVKGLIWVHGESDIYQYESTLPQYPARFADVVARIRATLESFDSANQLVDASGMRVMMTSINHQAYVWKRGHLKDRRDGVLQYNRGLATLTRQSGPRIAGSVYIKTTGLQMVKGNNVHYDGTGNMQLGQRIASAVVRLQ